MNFLKTMIFYLSLLAFLAILPFSSLQAQCLKQPPVFDLTVTFHKSLKDANQPIQLAILPFQDASLTGIPDSTLQNLFPILFADILNHTKKIKTAPALPILEAFKDQPSAKLFDETAYISWAESEKIPFLLQGMFQKRGTELRVFWKWIDVAKKEMVFVEEATWLQDDRVTVGFVEAAESILSKAKLGKLDEKWKAAYLKKTPRFEALRYYVKGMEKSVQYNEDDLSIAQIWFEKAVQEDYRFEAAKIEKARTFWMLALIGRQKDHDVSMLMQKAREVSAESRWSQSALNFVSGTRFLETGDAAKAIPLLQQAVNQTPEDGLAHFYLAKALGSSSTEGAKEMTLAKRLNPCLQQ